MMGQGSLIQWLVVQPLKGLLIEFTAVANKHKSKYYSVSKQNPDRYN